MKPLAQNSLIQNRYLVVHLIGKGGMGEVYLAVDQRLGSAVALKRTYFAGDETLGNAFEREARTLARMRHPVLPKVSDHFGEGDEQYLVMEHISGEDLAKRLEVSQKPFPVSWVLFWADQLLDALSYLHSHEPPIIHRDIKPQNLKLTDDNNIVLLDFGLSKTSTGMTNISQSGSTGSVVGYTPHYAPMEQVRGIGTNPRSDLYSLSATLYQLLTNVVPQDALTRADIMLTGAPDPIKPLHELNAEISKPVSDAILKGMEVSQEKRFADAREMQRVLRRAYSDMSGAEDVTSEQAPAVALDAQRQSASRDREDVAASESFDQSASNTDFDATIAYDPIAESELKQSAIKTEVFLAGDDGFPADVKEKAAPLPPAGLDGHQPVFDQSKTDVQTAAGTNDKFSVQAVPNETVPLITFDNDHRANEAADVRAAASERVAPAQAQGKKHTGKAAVVFGALAAVFILTVAGSAVGWYIYSRVSQNRTAAESAASPEPTPEASATPMPTVEAAAESGGSNANSSTLTAAEDINTNSSTETNSNTDVLTVAPTPEPTPLTDSDAAVRPAQASQSGGGAGARSQGRQATQNVPKQTVKPKTPSDRTVILQ